MYVVGCFVKSRDSKEREHAFHTLLTYLSPACNDVKKLTDFARFSIVSRKLSRKSYALPFFFLKKKKPKEAKKARKAIVILFLRASRTVFK